MKELYFPIAWSCFAECFRPLLVFFWPPGFSSLLCWWLNPGTQSLPPLLWVELDRISEYLVVMVISEDEFWDPNILMSYDPNIRLIPSSPSVRRPSRCRLLNNLNIYWLDFRYFTYLAHPFFSIRPPFISVHPSSVPPSHDVARSEYLERPFVSVVRPPVRRCQTIRIFSSSLCLRPSSLPMLTVDWLVDIWPDSHRFEQ